MVLRQLIKNQIVKKQELRRLPKCQLVKNNHQNRLAIAWSLENASVAVINLNKPN